MYIYINIYNIHTYTHTLIHLDNETCDFSATWSEARQIESISYRLSFTSIIFRFCIWSKITDVSRKMTSDILQHL